jgi:hypothetical protein
MLVGVNENTKNKGGFNPNKYKPSYTAHDKIHQFVQRIFAENKHTQLYLW